MSERHQLLQSAGRLCGPSAATAAEYTEKREQLLADLNAEFLKREDLISLVRDPEMMRDNHSNHTRFMAALFQAYVPEVLVDTVIWVFKTYRAHGFSPHYWDIQLNIWPPLLEAHLSTAAYQEIHPFYEWLLLNCPTFTALSEADVPI